jgi:hypothetical protein
MSENTALAIVVCVIVVSIASCTVLTNHSDGVQSTECSRLQLEAAKQASAPKLACELPR